MSSIRCPVCKKFTSANFSNCLGCGSDLSAPNAGADAPAKQAPQYGRGSWAVVGMTVLVFSVFMINLIWQARNRAEPPPKAVEIVSNSAWDGSVSQVEGFLKKNLKDPASFEVIEWGGVAKTGSGFVVRCKYRAKNSFGGYVIDDKIFMLDAAGKVTGAVSVGS